MSATEIPCVPPLSITPYFITCLVYARARVSYGVSLRHEVLDFQVLQSLSNMSMYPVGMGCHPLLYPPVAVSFFHFIDVKNSLQYLRNSHNISVLHQHHAGMCAFLISRHVFGLCVLELKPCSLILANVKTTRTAVQV